MNRLSHVVVVVVVALAWALVCCSAGKPTGTGYNTSSPFTFQQPQYFYETLYYNPTGGTVTSANLPLSTMQDVNGDGLPDFVVNYYLATDNPQQKVRTVYLNNGCNWILSTAWTEYCPTPSAQAVAARVHAAAASATRYALVRPRGKTFGGDFVPVTHDTSLDAFLELAGQVLGSPCNTLIHAESGARIHHVNFIRDREALWCS